MWCSIEQLKALTPTARDGEVGKLSEVYFDDERWVIRYLVVATGGWFSGREVLISPHAVQRLDRDGGRLELNLTREQIERAPGIETDKPVARQQEASYHDHYGYPYYWGGVGLWGAAAYPLGAPALPVGPGTAAPEGELPAELARREDAERDRGDPHLRSSAEVAGYHIEATDGSIGHVEDLLFDERDWQVRGVIVDTRNWLPGRLVLVTPRSLRSISWSERRAHVSLTREAVKASPPYERGARLDDAYVQRVQRHFDDGAR